MRSNYAALPPNPYERLASPEESLGAFLPEFRGHSVAYLNLNEEACGVFSTGETPLTTPSRLADAMVCDTFVQALHAKYGVSASFGGYLEDRAILWQGTYLGGSEKTLHLGVDLNAPSGSVVSTPIAGRVVRHDNDHPERWGWGPRIFLEINPQDAPPSVLIFAHLGEVSAKVGDNLTAGATIGVVGAPPHNGNWFPHLHVQNVRREVFDAYLHTDIWTLDGYGERGAVEQLRHDFPDPILTLLSGDAR
jgi:murein DD-endopeptidase MepM/ murein hydrolase activator NlpD